MSWPRAHLLAAAGVLLAALAVPPEGNPQSLFDDVGGDAEAQALALVEAAEAEGGPQAEGLIGPLMALGFLYEESGRAALAAAVVERAWQLVRVHYGLYTFDQAPMIRQRIDQERARGDLTTAWNLEQGLLILARRNPGDLRTVAVLREVGDNRLAVLDDYFEGGFPPEIFLGCYYQTEDCISGSQRVVIQSLLAEASWHYTNAVKALLANDQYSSDELREIETQIARYLYIYGRVYGDGRDYPLGRESLRRLAAYESAAAAPLAERIAALVRIADWDTVFARDGRLRAEAREIYLSAYRELEANGLGEAIETLFAPELPITLPDFMPNWLASGQSPDSTGHIDVRFDVTFDGKADDIEILDTTANASRAARRDLRQTILRSRFRPRAVAGQLAEAAPVTVRYYVSE